MSSFKNKFYKLLLLVIGSILTVFTVSSCRCHKHQPAKYGPPPSFTDTQIEKTKLNTNDVTKADSLNKIQHYDNMFIAKYGTPSSFDKK